MQAYLGFRMEEDFQHFEEDLQMRTVDVAGKSFLYSWGCVLRFLLFDMLLRCEGYEPSTAIPAEGDAIPATTRRYLFGVVADVEGRDMYQVAPALVSPLCVLQDLDLESTTAGMSTQMFFTTALSLGSVKSMLIQSSEMFLPQFSGPKAANV
ncbi:hypothetical protein B0H19DRAFT_1259724 [Mycena capillaripes]|nr:hypothetical protein B0H19DRAFT_1259724 [Mycena capillaripes]